MAPETRSGGVPPPSRVYHSSPALQQAQFPARRRTVRKYGGKQSGSRNSTPGRTGEAASSSSSSLRQQTLTQINFVPSLGGAEEGPIVLSDSEEDEFREGGEGDEHDGGIDKENQGHAEADEELDDEEPVSSDRKRRAAKSTKAKSSSKRRRTLEATASKRTAKKEKTSRRKTVGDAPSSNYHTQTLTQVLGQRSFVQDSDEEAAGGFDDWLGQLGSPSPTGKQAAARDEQGEDLASTNARNERRTRTAAAEDGAANDGSRATSIVPQTPVKRIRFEIPSSTQTTNTTPTLAMMDRYPAPDKQPDMSPLKERSRNAEAAPKELSGRPKGTPAAKENRSLVVEDSFATESWASIEGTPTRGAARLACQREGSDKENVPAAASPTPEADMTPTKRSGRPEIRGSVMGQDTGSSGTTGNSGIKPLQERPASLREIPDSDEEDEESEDEHEHEHEHEYVAGADTQRIMNEIASTEERAGSALPPLGGPPPSSTMSLAAERQWQDSSRIVMPSSATSLPRAPSPRSVPGEKLPKQPVLRQPLHPPSSPGGATQAIPLESQRVSIHILHSMPSVSVRTDVVLPISRCTLTSLVSGHQVALELPFKILTSVSRLWLLESGLLRFMACVEQGELFGAGLWRYPISQVFELNNPMDEASLREEFLLDKVDRYAWVPPSIASQMLYNLRQAIFKDGDDSIPEGEQEADDDCSDGIADSGSQLPPVVTDPELKDRSLTKRRSPTSSFCISEQVEAQLQSDIAQSAHCPTSDDVIVPSTPDEAEDEGNVTIVPRSEPRPKESRPQHQQQPQDAFDQPLASLFRTPAKPSSQARHRDNSFVHPSQATTASQLSTPEKSSRSQPPPAQSPSPTRTQHQKQEQEQEQSLSHPPLPSSSSLIFPQDSLECGVSPITLPPHSNLGILSSSQLLSRSQMLPDSLLRDDADAPPNIWDSVDE